MEGAIFFFCLGLFCGLIFREVDDIFFGGGGR